MDTGDIPRELVQMPHLLGAGAGVVHGLRHRADALPFIVGEGGRVQAAMPLVMVLDGSPIVPRGIGRVKLVAQDSGDRIFAEQVRAKELAAGAIALSIPL